MSTGTQVCDITLPGYVLTERIGSGGYAEVWRAEAPGGIEKAVKVVYGCYDDEFASQELKALERIKGVRHPFLLSLERFEIINGRLAILTELADMSLDQRLTQCRADGLPGIPRDELLHYMADAAEALDFLSQRHSLLHLDIKPENLLVSGDHIKVADFGLVKELATRTQNSLVSGMTPTYAAPEMFDDDPSAHSDQYSLAIVYQEMLVGALPFPGRTAAQLAKQHTQAEPQLMSLPVEDRPVIARALAKRPTDRYPSCRAFVEALLHRPTTPSAFAPSEVPAIPVIPRPTAPDEDDTKPPSFCTTIRRPPAPEREEFDVKVTQSLHRGPQKDNAPAAEAAATFVPEVIIDVGVPETDTQFRREQPTLYIATGGLGIQVLCRLRALTATFGIADKTNKAIETIAFDTDRDELREACSSRWKSPLSADDTRHLPLRLPKSYDNSSEILGWLSRRWLYNIPRSLETRGYRPLGRVALVDHLHTVRGLIDQKLQLLAAAAGSADSTGEARDTAIKVVLLTGTGGGTGAGMAIDIANAVRALATARNLQFEVQGFLVCTCFANNNSSPLVIANTYSLLLELNHATDCGNQSACGKSTQNQLFESRNAPFDCLYCVPARPRTKDTQTADALDSMANYLALEHLPEPRAALRSCRRSPTPNEQLSGRSLVLKKLGLASLADHRSQLVNELAAELAKAIKQHWLTKDTSHDWERLVRDEQRSASVLKLEPTSGSDDGSPPVVVSVNDATPLAIRGRLNEFKSLEFASEMLRQIQHQLASRDDRGRPRILGRDAKLIADTARGVIASVAQRASQETLGSNRFAESAALRQLIAAGSRRVLSQAVERFDFRVPERFLPGDVIDDIVLAECHALLEESLTQPDFAAAINLLMDVEMAANSAIASATTDLFQCGCDRRTLLFVPKDEADGKMEEKLRTLRPQAAVIPTAVNDVLVVSEESGISPRSLAIGFERVYPGIADAARRLFTRIDIDWQKLV